MKYPWYQTAIILLGFIIVGLTALGSVLDALSNAVQLVTPPVTYWGTVLLIFLWLIAFLVMRFLHVPWIARGGERVRLTRPGVRFNMALIGMVLLLWFPRMFPHSPPVLDMSTRVAPNTVEDFDLQAPRVSKLPAIVTSIASGYPRNSVYKVGVREGLDYFVVHTDPAYRPSWRITISRDRSEANLVPLSLTFSDPVSDARYEKISQFAEGAIVAWHREGSGNFLTIHVLLWLNGTYRDLATSLERDLPDAYFTFADLDADGWMELIVTRGRKAIDKTTRFYRLDLSQGQYREVAPGTHWSKLSEVADNSIFELNWE